MECFGKFTHGNPACKTCSYVLACRYSKRSGGKLDRREHIVSFEAAANLADSADYQHIPGMEEDAGESDRHEEMISRMSQLLHYLLELDAYSLAIIAEVIKPAEPGVHCTVPYLSRRQGCSRQAMHRKIMKIIGAHPELAGLFSSTLYKLSEARQNFLRHRANRAVGK
jgi:hypothetical protein